MWLANWLFGLLLPVLGRVPDHPESSTEDITAPLESLLCYRQHKSYVGAQTVAYWLTWLAPIPSWLQSIVMMQQVNVTRAQTTLQTGFDCTAFR